MKSNWMSRLPKTHWKIQRLVFSISRPQKNRGDAKKTPPNNKICTKPDQHPTPPGGFRGLLTNRAQPPPLGTPAKGAPWWVGQAITWQGRRLEINTAFFKLGSFRDVFLVLALQFFGQAKKSGININMNGDDVFIGWSWNLFFSQSHF